MTRELIPRVVFDCNLFVQGIANRNSLAQGAAAVFHGDISLFVSKPIIREVRDVLNRAELRRKLPGINDRIVLIRHTSYIKYDTRIEVVN